MSKNKQIDNILITLNAIKWNLDLLKKSKIKKKYVLETIYPSVWFHLKIINKLIILIWDKNNEK